MVRLSSMKIMLVASVGMMLPAFMGSGVYGQSVSKRVISISKTEARSQAMQVAFKCLEESFDKSVLESIQNTLQNIEGVRYVGVNYRSGEVLVRYFPERVRIGTLTSVLDKTRNRVAITAGPEIVKSEAVGERQIDVHGFIPHVQFQCLRHEEARALCERHFDGRLPDGVDLEQCYTLKVDFRATKYLDRDYDWLAHTRLVGEKGALVKPLGWLEFPIREARTRGRVSGLLIFPKIPLLKIGLTLRLLRANGEGYDSYTVDVPDLTKNER